MRKKLDEDWDEDVISGINIHSRLKDGGTIAIIRERRFFHEDHKI